jgi:hypothetical protein
VLDEILEERVQSSRSRQNPRGVKRTLSGYKVRPRCHNPTAKMEYVVSIQALK